MQAGITAWIKQHGAAFVALAAAVGAVVANTQAGSFVAETEHILTTAIAVGGFGGAVLHAFLNGLQRRQVDIPVEPAGPVRRACPQDLALMVASTSGVPFHAQRAGLPRPLSAIVKGSDRLVLVGEHPAAGEDAQQVALAPVADGPQEIDAAAGGSAASGLAQPSGADRCWLAVPSLGVNRLALALIAGFHTDSRIAQRVQCGTPGTCRSAGTDPATRFFCSTVPADCRTSRPAPHVSAGLRHTQSWSRR